MKIGKPRGDNYKLVLSGLQPSQRDYIELLASCSLEDLFMHLEAFPHWVWDKSDLLCWAPVLNRFDEIYCGYLDSYRGYVKFDHDSTSSFYNVDLLGIVRNALKASVMIVENSTSKSLYNSVDILTSFLDDIHPDIVFLATRVLCVYFSRQRRSASSKDPPEIAARIAILSQPPLPDSTCRVHATRNSSSSVTVSQDYLESRTADDFDSVSYSDVIDYYANKKQYFLTLGSYIEIGQDVGKGNETARLRIPVVEILNIGRDGYSGQGATNGQAVEGDDAFMVASQELVGSIPNSLALYAHMLNTLRLLIKKYKIEEHTVTELKHKLTKIYAMYFPYLQRLLVEIRLGSLICMLIMSTTTFNQFLSYNPSFLLELTHMMKRHNELERSTTAIVSELLSTMVYDGVHSKTLTNLLGLNSPHGIFTKVLLHYLRHPHENEPLPPLLRYKSDGETKKRYSVNEMLEQNKLSVTEDKNEKQICALQVKGYVVDKERCLKDLNWNTRFSTEEGRIAVQYHEDAMRILLQLLIVFYTTISYHHCSSALGNSAILEAVVNFIRIRDPIYLPVVIYVVQVLEALLEYSPTVARTLRKNLDIYFVFASRMQYDMYFLERSASIENEAVQLTPWPKGWKIPAVRDILVIKKYWMSLSSVSARRFLFKTMVRNIDTAARSLTGRSESHDQNVFLEKGPIISIIFKILSDPHVYGLCAYGSAVNLIAEALGEDPLIQSELHRMEVVPAMLVSISEDTLKSEECLQIVPGAICDVLAHKSGQEWLQNNGYSPAMKLMDVVVKKDFVLYDRFGEIATSIGVTMGTLSREESANDPIMEHVIKMMKGLLEEAMTYPAFRPKDSVTCAKECESYLQEFKTHAPAITTELLSKKNWTSENDFYADRIAHLAKFLLSYLSYVRPISQFIATDGLKLVYQLCSVPCLPPLTMLIYQQHPMTVLIKNVLGSAPVPCISYMHGICRPYMLQPICYKYPRTEEDVFKNVEYLRMFHGISYTLYMVHRDDSNIYGSCCSGKFQLGAKEISKCETHLTISCYMKRVVAEIPLLMRHFFSATYEGEKDKNIILAGKHLPHEHPQLKAYKAYNRDAKVPQNQSEFPFSANDFFWTSQFDYSYSVPNPSYVGSSNAELPDDLFKMNTELCRLSLVTAKALLYSINNAVNASCTSALPKNACARKYVAHHCYALCCLCNKMLSTIPSVESFNSRSDIFIRDMDAMNTARFVAETMEMTFKLLTDEKAAKGIHILSLVVFIRLSGMRYLKSALDYMFYCFLGSILSLAMRTNPGVSAKDILGTEITANAHYLMAVADYMQNYDLKKVKHTMDIFSRAILICLALFNKICNYKNYINTQYDLDLLEYTSSDEFLGLLPVNEEKFSEVLTNAVTLIGTSCWQWLKAIASLSSAAPGNSTACPHFYISSKLVGSLMKVTVYMTEFRSKAHQESIQAHFDIPKIRFRDSPEANHRRADRLFPISHGNQHSTRVLQFSRADDNIDDPQAIPVTIEDTRSRLTEMGFDSDDIERALVACGHMDLLGLTGWLINAANMRANGENDQEDYYAQGDSNMPFCESADMNDDESERAFTSGLYSFNCSVEGNEEDIRIMPMFPIVDTGLLSDFSDVLEEIGSTFVKVVLGLSTKMPTALGVLCENTLRPLSLPCTGDQSENEEFPNEKHITTMIDFIYNRLENIYQVLSGMTFSMTREELLPLFCPAIFMEDIEKQAALDSTVLLQKSVLDPDQNCELAKIHEELLGLFFIMAHLIAGKDEYASMLLKHIRNPVEMIMKFISFFQDLRYEAHTSGIITFAGIGMKPILPGIPIAIPDWCTHMEFVKFQSKDKTTFKARVEYSLTNYGFLRSSSVPQMSCVPPFFRYALACICEIVQKHCLVGLSNMLGSSMDFSNNVELLSITKNVTFLPKHSQKKLVRMSLSILECFPGSDSDVVHSVLSILECLTESYSNVIEFMKYKRLPLQENYPAHFNSKVELSDMIGADALSLLLTIPKSGECRGILKMVAKIIMQCMENPDMIKEAIEAKVIDMLSKSTNQEIPIVGIIEKVYPFIKKDPMMLLKILQNNCVITLEDGATKFDLCKSSIALRESPRIKDLLESNAELLHPGSIPPLESVEEDNTPFVDHNELLLSVLRILVVYMQIFCNIHGLTRLNMVPGEVTTAASRPVYPYSFTVNSLLYIVDTVCCNFPVPVNNNKTPKLELDMPHKPFPWRVNMIDVKDSHMVLLQIVRRVFLMVCSLSVPRARGQQLKDMQPEAGGPQKLIVTTLDSYTNSILSIASRDMNMCIAILEEVKIMLLFLIGFNPKDCGPHYYPVAAYTVCNLLQNLLQMRFNKSERVELSPETAFQIKRCLITLLRRLDLNKEGSGVLCTIITRSLVLVTSPNKSERNAFTARTNAQNAMNENYEHGVDEIDIAVDMDTESYDSDDEALSSQEDVSEGDSEVSDEYMDDAMDEDVATDSGTEEAGDSITTSDADNDGSHYNSESEDDESGSSESEGLDTDQGSEGANDVEMVLPHQVDENYQEPNEPDSSSHSSMDDMEGDEDDDDAPRIRVVGELDEEGRDEVIADFMEGTRSPLNITDNDEHRAAEDSQVSSEEDEFDLPPTIPPGASNLGFGRQNNSMSINIDDPNLQLPGTNNNSIRIQIEIGNQQNPFNLSEPFNQGLMSQALRMQQQDAAANANNDDFIEFWANSGDLSVPSRHPLLPPPKKLPADSSLQNGDIINLIAVSLPKVQIPKAVSGEVSDSYSEERGNRSSDDSSAELQADQESQRLTSAPAGEQSSQRPPHAYDNINLEHIALGLGIEYNDLFTLANMDQTVIAELPEEMREEILLQQLGTIDVEAATQLRETRHLGSPEAPANMLNRMDMRYVDALPRALRPRVFRYLYNSTNHPLATRSSAGLGLDFSELFDTSVGNEQRIWSAIGPSLRDHLVQGATQAFLDALAPNLSAGRSSGAHRREESHETTSESNMNDDDGLTTNDPALLIEGHHPRVMATTPDGRNQQPGMTFGLIIGEFHDGNNLRIRNPNLHRNRNTNNANRRFGPISARRRLDAAGGRERRGFNINDVILLDNAVNRVRLPGQNSIDSTDSFPTNIQGLIDGTTAHIPPTTMAGRNTRRDILESHILRSIPQLLNNFQPHIMNMIQNGVAARQAATQPQANVNAEQVAVPHVESHAAEVTCETLIDNVSRLIPKSVCEVAVSRPGDEVCQLLDDVRAAKNEFMEGDVIGVCKLIYLKEEINKKIYFRLLHNLCVSDPAVGLLLLKYFLYIMHTSILALSHTSVSTIQGDCFFVSLPRLQTSKKEDFPPTHMYGSFPHKHIFYDNCPTAEGRQSANQLSMGGGHNHSNCIDLHGNTSSYVSCERVLEQLRSLMIALPGIVTLFGKKISFTMGDDSSSRHDSRAKRTRNSDTSAPLSRTQEFYPIGFLFMATATKLFQSSPKLMNHLLMIIHNLVVTYPSFNFPTQLGQNGPAMEPTADTRTGENNNQPEARQSTEEHLLGADNSAAAPRRMEEPSTLRNDPYEYGQAAQTEVVRTLDRESLRVFLDVHLSWNYQTHWLHAFATSRDGPAGNQMRILSRIMSTLYAHETHSKDVIDIFVLRTQQLSDELSKMLFEINFEATTATEHRINALSRIVLLVNDMLSESLKTQPVLDPKILSQKPRTFLEFYNRIGFEKLWQGLDSAMISAMKTTPDAPDAMEQAPSNDQGSQTRNNGTDPPGCVERLNTLIPIIEVYMFLTQLRVALDYLLEDVNELDNAISFINFDYELPEGNLDFIGVAKQARIPSRKRSSDSDETSLEISPNHLSLIYFTEKHSKAFNAVIKPNPTLLSTSFISIVRLSPNCLNFGVKRQYFRQKIKETRQVPRPENLRISIRRNHVFMDSYHQLRLRTGDEMKGKLVVTFNGEEGVDAGGLTREWYSILAKEMFNPDYCLFRREGRKQEFNHPNPLSGINPDHLNFFKFIGRVIGKAIYDGQHIAAYFCRSFYKHMLCRKIIPADAESVDPQFYQNLTSINNCKLEDLGLELYFSTEIDEFGKVKVIDLIPDGRNIQVTDENKQKYIELLCRHKVTNAIKDQLDAFMSGFQELISPELVSIFDDKELELLISGIPTIDLSDLRENVEYVNYTAQSDQIVWLWEFLGGLDQDNIAAFLQFVTGTSRVPLGGFKYLMGMRGPQRISIHRTFGSERLPTAHTCFNQLDLPAYSSKEQLQQKMMQAIQEGKEGFGFI